MYSFVNRKPNMSLSQTAHIQFISLNDTYQIFSSHVEFIKKTHKYWIIVELKSIMNSSFYIFCYNKSTINILSPGSNTNEEILNKIKWHVYNMLKNHSVRHQLYQDISIYSAKCTSSH